MRSFYDFFMIPLEKRGIRKNRQKLIPKAYGNVLEIGSGTGANLTYYHFDQIDELIVTDQKLSKTIKKKQLEQIHLMEMDVANLPFEDHRFDTIVHTLVFCSVHDVQQGLNEIRRVLKPGGQIIFIEHVLPEHGFLRNLFQFINPVWKRVASGCNLTRSYQDSLIEAGFEIHEFNQFMKTVFISGIALQKQKA